MSVAYTLECVVLLLPSIYFIIFAIMKGLSTVFGQLFTYYIISLLGIAFRLASCLIGELEAEPSKASDLKGLCDCACYGLIFFACFKLMINIHLRAEWEALPQSRRLIQYLYPSLLAVWLIFSLLDAGTHRPASRTFINLGELVSYYLCMICLLYSVIAVLHGVPDFTNGKIGLVLTQRLRMLMLFVVGNIVLGALQSFFDLGGQVAAAEWLDLLADVPTLFAPMVCFWYPEDYGFEPVKEKTAEPVEPEKKVIEVSKQDILNPAALLSLEP